MRVRKLWIPHGDAGTAAVVREMRRVARDARHLPLVRKYAVRIVHGISGRDTKTQVDALRAFLLSHIQFLRDPAGVELLYTPERLLQILTDHGPPLRIDCDDVSALTAALAGAIGLRSRFVVVGFLSSSAPFSHVWTDVSAPTRHSPWYQLDITRPAQALPPDQAVSRRWIVRVT